MRESLLEILAEPGTGSTLKLDVTRHTRSGIDEGTLTSTETGKAYPIIRGIPRFVEGSVYADSFGMQWNAFRATQLDSKNGAKYSEDRFENETTWAESDLKGKRVLDAGCGAGRFAEIAAARGAELVALDLSSAVEAASETIGRYGHVDVVQASLLELPFRKHCFDFAYSLGVIQHTPAPAAGIASVLSGVKKGGRFAFTIYARRPWSKLNAKYLVRPITKRLPAEVLLKGIEASMPVLFPLTDVMFRLPVVGKLARFTMPVANYVERSDTLTREQRYQECVLDTFDMLSPMYDSPMTWQEVEAAFRSEGASHWNWRSRVPIVVEGTL
jgi:SAM-dependent methyltransferase/uncharacterized protein YbaR (Trm112 family)